MSDLNGCTFSGRVTRDAEMTTVGAKNTTIVKWGIANNTGFGQYEKTNFFTLGAGCIHLSVLALV